MVSRRGGRDVARPVADTNHAAHFCLYLHTANNNNKTTTTTTTKFQKRIFQFLVCEAAENINEAPPNLYLLLIQLQKVRNARNRTSFPVSNKGTSVRNFKSCASELVPQGPLPNHRLRPFVVMEQNGSCMRRGQERVVKRGPRPS